MNNNIPQDPIQHIEVTKRLCYKAGLGVHIKIPVVIYETVKRWEKEWKLSESKLPLYEWCLEFKQGNRNKHKRNSLDPLQNEIEGI